MSPKDVSNKTDMEPEGPRELKLRYQEMRLHMVNRGRTCKHIELTCMMLNKKAWEPR